MHQSVFIRALVAAVIGGWTAGAVGFAQTAIDGVRNRPKKIELEPAETSTRIVLRDHLPSLPVTVGERSGLYFVLDTAATVTAIDNDVVKALGIDVLRTLRPEGDDTDSSESETAVVRLPSMTVGAAKLVDLEAVVMDFDALADGRRLYDGVLGLPVFADLLLRMDFPQKRLRLRSADEPFDADAEFIEYRLETGRPAVPLQVAGKTMGVILSSGSDAALILHSSMMQDVPLAPRMEHLATRRNLLTDVDPEQQVVAGTVRIGRYELDRPPVNFQDRPGRIGYDILRHFVVTVDQNSRRISFSRPDQEPVTFPVRSRFGLVLTRRGLDLRIVQVIEGTPAARFRLLETDIIKSFDGKQPGDLTDDQIVERLTHANTLFLRLEREGFLMDLPMRAKGF